MKKNNPIFRNSFFAKGAMAVLISASLVSCTKNNEFANVSTSSQANIAKVSNFLATSTGVDVNQVSYQPDTKNFIISNDIAITEKDANDRMTASTGTTTEQWKYNYLISRTQVTNIDYFFESSVPDSWKSATRKAIQNWNAVNGTILYLRETSVQSSSNVVVKMGYSTSNWVAQAYLPSYNGLPGYQITINSNYNSLSDSYKIFAITHEMGHTFGLMHTDQQSGIFINGTPTTDSKSVMNSVVLPWQAFTAGDIKAVQTLYP